MGERPAPVPGVDVLFTDEDATEILDYLADRHLVCEGCGQPKVESFAPENEWAYKATALVCLACAAGSRAISKVEDRASARVIIQKIS